MNIPNEIKFYNDLQEGNYVIESFSELQWLIRSKREMHKDISAYIIMIGKDEFPTMDEAVEEAKRRMIKFANQSLQNTQLKP